MTTLKGGRFYSIFPTNSQTTAKPKTEKKKFKKKRQIWYDNDQKSIKKVPPKYIIKNLLREIKYQVTINLSCRKKFLSFQSKSKSNVTLDWKIILVHSFENNFGMVEILFDEHGLWFLMNRLAFNGVMVGFC